MSVTLRKTQAVIAQTGISRSGIYYDTKKGIFPPGIKLGPRKVGWPDYEIDQIVAARIRGASEAELRDLVNRLVAERKAAR